MPVGSPILPIAAAPRQALGSALWHPLAPGTGTTVEPWMAALAVAAVGLAAALALPHRRPAGAGGAPVDAWEGDLDRPRWAGRVVAVAALVVAIVAGRVGDPDQLRNLAPSLVIGVGWPLAVLACLLLGPAWRWLAPVDALARLSAPSGAAVADVRPALVSTGAWVWYLAAFDRGLEPRTLAFALAGYVVVHLAMALALGRRRWLSSGEVFGLFLGWTGRVRRGGLTAWAPPRGAAAVLGVLAGGVAFAAFRRSGTWVDWTAGTSPLGWATGGVALAAVIGAVALVSLERAASERGAAGSVAAAAVPCIAAGALAVSLVSYRLTTTAQLVVIHLSDPFGQGWNLFGTATWRLNAQPVSHAALETIQLGILAAGVAIAGAVVARRARGAARAPAAAAIGLLGAGLAYSVASSAI